MNKCSVENCANEYYAKGYCVNHYNLVRRTGGTKLQRIKRIGKCNITNCLDPVLSLGYCSGHYYRFKKYNNPLEHRHNENLKGINKGEKNINWRGGKSQYMNHYEFKKNRIIKLQETKGCCEICGRDGFEVHHKDETTTNHNLDNLIVLCRKCHGMAHTGKKYKTSKFVRLYGMSLKDLAEKFGGSETRIFLLHRQGKLKELIETK